MKRDLLLNLQTRSICSIPCVHIAVFHVLKLLLRINQTWFRCTLGAPPCRALRLSANIKCRCSRSRRATRLPSSPARLSASSCWSQSSTSFRAHHPREAHRKPKRREGQERRGAHDMPCSRITSRPPDITSRPPRCQSCLRLVPQPRLLVPIPARAERGGRPGRPSRRRHPTCIRMCYAASLAQAHALPPRVRVARAAGRGVAADAGWSQGLNEACHPPLPVRSAAGCDFPTSCPPVAAPTPSRCVARARSAVRCGMCPRKHVWR